MSCQKSHFIWDTRCLVFKRFKLINHIMQYYCNTNCLTAKKIIKNRKITDLTQIEDLKTSPYTSRMTGTRKQSITKLARRVRSLSEIPQVRNDQGMTSGNKKTYNNIQYKNRIFRNLIRSKNFNSESNHKKKIA